ncbi:hypothetical protein T4A_1989 [Trichinella pseudospiralis]|uniref:DUF5641 domain-containing protein n=1 Tax=Trichinella pseudospiralis TaxID=6337 RepID=A0A0V1JW66_TRIPS|nr:hypothetical protein T4A_1989 [Trichinella pseudospiralis]KRY90334.1 hypothetical protein T4D_16014 [Trichinella pseudospiralis]KRZ39144.1 hypothetical protein T4C_5082 [Trichinella pseudospiralis]
MELYPWSDGIKRSALVKIATGTLVRTIRKLQLNEPATSSDSQTAALGVVESFKGAKENKVARRGA